ncbi:MAG TPA: alpha/beta fold hydrolase [Acidimicrobiia bacterium]|nr:alpha/beta fold hydrolase [Acidimicrobiia bacterium]
MPEVVTGDGVSIHYEVWGRRAATPVLMIQGLGADSRGWALQRMAFGRRHRCYALDNRGVGQSDRPPGPYSLDRMAGDAIAVLDQEGIESAHVMGASMGGVIAQILAVLHPGRVRSLTLACTACRHHQWRRELLAEWAAAVAEDGTSALAREALQWLVGPRLHRRFGVWLNLMARVVLQTPPEPFVAQVEAILAAPDDVRFALADIADPTLIITGSQDSLTPVGDAEELAELVPHARLEVVTGAAHGLMVEAPNAFNDAVLRFLADVDAAVAATASDGTAAESA